MKIKFINLKIMPILIKESVNLKKYTGFIKAPAFIKSGVGFTLIELLIVIAIIGLLSTLAVIALTNARLKSRDARRITDIKQIQNALELYFSDCNGYPTAVTAGNSLAGNDGSCTPANTNIYMKIVPSNPTPKTDGSCPNSDYSYTRDGGSTYHITYCIGGMTGGVPGGTHRATPAGIKND